MGALCFSQQFKFLFKLFKIKSYLELYDPKTEKYFFETPCKVHHRIIQCLSVILYLILNINKLAVLESSKLRLSQLMVSRFHSGSEFNESILNMLRSLLPPEYCQNRLSSELFLNVYL